MNISFMSTIGLFIVNDCKGQLLDMCHQCQEKTDVLLRVTAGLNFKRRTSTSTNNIASHFHLVVRLNQPRKHCSITLFNKMKYTKVNH